MSVQSEHWDEHALFIFFDVNRSSKSPDLPRDDHVLPEQPLESMPEEETHQPAWKRKNLEKELEEISAIEATAIAIRQGLQDLQEEKDTCDVDADAAALMLELRGGRSAKTARRSSSVGDHEAMALLAELQAVKESDGGSQVNERSEATQSDSFGIRAMAFRSDEDEEDLERPGKGHVGGAAEPQNKQAEIDGAVEAVADDEAAIATPEVFIQFPSDAATPRSVCCEWEIAKMKQHSALLLV
eukprot:s1573_g19.t1